MIKKITKKLLNTISNGVYRLQNRNKCFSLISRDCIGGIVYKQLKLPFLSPTINLFFTPGDFNKLCLSLEKYINGILVEKVNSDKKYPIGLLYPDAELKQDDEIVIHFVHYKSFKDALEKWEERKKRINWEDIYIVSTFCYESETTTFSNTLINNWNKIKYKKVIIVDKNYGFSNEFIVKKPKNTKSETWLLNNMHRYIEWKRIFNKFNFIKFLNMKEKE